MTASCYRCTAIARALRLVSALLVRAVALAPPAFVPRPVALPATVTAPRASAASQVVAPAPQRTTLHHLKGTPPSASAWSAGLEVGLLEAHHLPDGVGEPQPEHLSHVLHMEQVVGDISQPSHARIAHSMEAWKVIFGMLLSTVVAAAVAFSRSWWITWRENPAIEMSNSNCTGSELSTSCVLGPKVALAAVAGEAVHCQPSATLRLSTAMDSASLHAETLDNDLVGVALKSQKICIDSTSSFCSALAERTQVIESSNATRADTSAAMLALPESVRWVATAKEHDKTLGISGANSFGATTSNLRQVSRSLVSQRPRCATIPRSSGWLDIVGGSRSNDFDAEQDFMLMEPPLEQLQARFQAYADGTGKEARLRADGLRNVLECADAFCLTKRWLPDTFVETIYSQYARNPSEGILLEEFNRMAHDGLLLSGKLDEYQKAFASMDSGTGVLTREAVGRLFAGLGRLLTPKELDEIVDEADISHDGIDFADFLRLARTHLDLRELLHYFQTHPTPAPDLPVDLASPMFDPRYHLGEVTTVYGEAELNGIIESGADTVVKLAFSWCRPCKSFLPKYKKLAKVYGDTRFIKIVGNENESCKHYAQKVLAAKISPMFAVYSKGKLVKTWHGANTGRFVENIEKNLHTAEAKVHERELADVV